MKKISVLCAAAALFVSLSVSVSVARDGNQDGIRTQYLEQRSQIKKENDRQSALFKSTSSQSTKTSDSEKKAEK
jgi:hypothetical protein